MDSCSSTLVQFPVDKCPHGHWSPQSQQKPRTHLAERTFFTVCLKQSLWAGDKGTLVFPSAKSRLSSQGYRHSSLLVWHLSLVKTHVQRKRWGDSSVQTQEHLVILMERPTVEGKKEGVCLEEILWTVRIPIPCYFVYFAFTDISREQQEPPANHT